VSGNPTVCGRTAWNKWQGKHLHDDFNRPIYEDAEFVKWTEIIPATETEAETIKEHGYHTDSLPQGITPPQDAIYTTQERRKLNPDYVEGQAYTPRMDRPEWDAIGLCGILPIHNGQPVNPNWKQMDAVSANITNWLVK
ncbi:MAG: hypothetical protein OEW37_11130, partial [Rhodospirillaceae bacterium]|nr:hypothetical protein [Rhodospirillaceae bacterium]